MGIALSSLVVAYDTSVPPPERWAPQQLLPEPALAAGPVSLDPLTPSESSEPGSEVGLLDGEVGSGHAVVEPEDAVALPPPASARALLDDDRHNEVDHLQSWSLDETLPAEVRYTALRLLEKASAPEALRVSRKLLSDSSSLVRLNAVGVLTRSSDPAAQASLEALDPRTRPLAKKLIARR
ncbi:MAG: hypothetical protein CMF76_10345 [Maricaulis sp.]|nr:hypothetical protein [Maricaulis sp.]